MTPEQYAAAQAAISAQLAGTALQLGGMFAGPVLTPSQWLHLLELLFPLVERARYESALLAREFYNDQRRLHHPELPDNDVPLVGTDFETFVESMEPTRARMSQAASRDDAVAAVALRAVRTVENAGRRQMIRSVQDDPVLDREITSTPSEGVKGWARVATGEETCSWCLMLISRGPVYLEASTAGFDVDDDTAVEMILNGEDISDLMEEWHTGCDCKVVPVFDQDNWVGKAQADRALDLWTEADLEARIRRDQEGPQVHRAGKNRGKPMTLNEEIINTLRRRLELGDIDASEWAALSAA